MRNQRRRITRGITLGLGALVLTGGATAMVVGDGPSKVQTKALTALAGNWAGSAKAYLAPGMPPESSGAKQQATRLGDYWLVEHASAQLFGDTLEHLYLIGFDDQDGLTGTLVTGTDREAWPLTGTYADKINGWYEPDTGRLVVVENDNQTMGRGTMLHEMFHALQDQLFDLERLHEQAGGGDAATQAERDRALRALIEGEAMLAVAELMDYDFGAHTALPMTGELDEARFEKIFHYGAGLDFVRALRDAGGWAQVDRAFQSPPTSTMQVLHPDRYLAGMTPEDLSGLAGPECNCTEEHVPSEVLGEFALSLFLARAEATRPDSARLAARLAGDLLHAIHDSESGGTRYAWYLSLHDELAAAELTALATDALGLEVWDLDPTGRRIGLLLEAHPLGTDEPEPEPEPEEGSTHGH